MITLLLFAAAHIYSPNFGAFVKTGPGITLDASVSSSDTPGSCDFSPAAHPYLKRPEATAFYALFDGYYARLVQYGSATPYTTCSPFASDIPSRDHAFLTVNTNALFNYSALMTCADNLVNKTTSAAQYPFYRYDRYTSSSAFDDLFSSWDAATFQSVITLDNWRTLALISDLDDDAVFHYRHTGIFPWGGYREPIIKSVFRRYDGCATDEQIHYNEYSTSGDTVPDILYAFDDAQSLGKTFKNLADLTWPANDIYQITNRSRAISWKPLCAISQTLALMDATLAAGEYDENLWTRLSHSEGVSYRYTRSASAPNCGSASITINDDGTITTGSTPAPSPSDVEVAPYESKTTYPSESGIFYALRVGAVGHHATVSCYTNLQSSVYEEMDVSDILDACGFTNRDVTCRLDLIANAPSVYWPYYSSQIDACVNDGPWHNVGSVYGDISDLEGSYAIMIKGTVDASYAYSEDDPYALHFAWDRYVAQKANVDTVREYSILSYAVTTNAHGTADFWFAPIDFGYHPPAAKPSPIDETMKYGYMRRSFETNAISYDAAKYTYDLDLLNTAKNKIHDEVVAITGGEYGDPDLYMGLTESAARDLLGEFAFQSAEMIYPESRVAYNVYVSPSGATTPEKVRYNANALIVMHYARTGGSTKIIHRAAGGDAKLRAAQKYKMAYPSIRTY